MAGIQQAVNAITGAYGTVAGRVGIYNELVGKNEELIKKTQAQNEELTKKNEQLQDFYDTVKQRQEFELQLDKEAEEEYNKQVVEKQQKREAAIERRKFNKELDIKRGAKAERLLDVQLAHASKNMMINALYGDFASGSGGGI